MWKGEVSLNNYTACSCQPLCDCTLAGAFFGLLDTFLFWLLQDLGAKKSLMGITVTVGTVAGIPILVASKSIIQKLGHANTIILSLAFYVLRMIGKYCTCVGTKS